MPKDFLEAGRARQLRLVKRRRLGVVGAFVALSLFAVGASFAALEFREKERQAIAQQELIRLAAGDVGRFELVLEPFDWSSVSGTKTSVRATRVPALDWRVHVATRTNPPAPGAILDAARVKRSERHVTDDGLLSELVEMGRDPVFFEFIGRGEGCGSSWLYVRSLPGYAERRTPPTAVRIPVPTCAASRAGAVQFDLPDAGVFALDRTEATSEMWALYAQLQPLSGDERTPMPRAFDREGVQGLPVVGIDAYVSDRLCRFFGRRLPRVAEWMRASKTHPQRTGVRREGCLANLEGSDDGADVLSPVGGCGGDATEEGVVDLLGNVSEWTSDDEPSGDYAGLRHYLGGNWSVPPGAPPTQIDYVNSGAATVVNYSLGVRCAADVP